MRSMAEQVRRDGLGRGVGVDAVKRAGEHHSAGWVSDCDDSVRELSTLDTDVTSCSRLNGDRDKERVRG